MTEIEHDDAILVALTMKILAGMARERGLERVAALGDLPPLDPATAARYLNPEEMETFLALRMEEVDDDERDDS